MPLHQQKSDTRPVLLYSAGVDCFVAYHKLKYQGTIPFLLHVTDHSMYSHKEIYKFKLFVAEEGLKQDQDYTILSLPFVKKHEDPQTGHIPARNLLFVMLGSYFGDTIYLVCQRGERDIIDRSEEFFRTATQLLTDYHEKPKLVDPFFWEETKFDLVAWYMTYIADIEKMKRLTVSCYDSEGEDTRCGKCNSCFRLACALVYNNIDTEDWFETNPFQSDLVEYYVSKLKAGSYESRRATQMIETLKKVGVWR